MRLYTSSQELEDISGKVPLWGPVTRVEAWASQLQPLVRRRAGELACGNACGGPLASLDGVCLRPVVEPYPTDEGYA